MGLLRNLFSGIRNKSSSISYVPQVGVTESFRGEVMNSSSRLASGLGEPHLYDLRYLEDLYHRFGLLNGIIDKYVDFVVGVGFYVKSENESAKQIIEDFMRDNQYDYLLRLWLKEALIKGTGYVELGSGSDGIPEGMRVLDSKYMFIKRDKYGTIEQVNQVKLSSRLTSYGNLSTSDFTSFSPDEIAILPINIIGNDCYGSGILAPALSIIDNLLGIQKDMNTLLHRKANAPIHAKIGNEQFMPDPGAISDFGQKLETMQVKTEFATDWLVDMKVLDFGDIGDKFSSPLKHYEDQLFFSVQIPEVIMGRGNIAEGIAKVQMATFERRVQSIQAELEKVNEQTIFRRVLNAHGLHEAHVEFEWGIESATEKNERITKITNLLNIAWTSPQLRSMLERELSRLMGLEEKELDEPAETDKFVPPSFPDTSPKKMEQNKKKKIPIQTKENSEEYEEEGVVFRVNK